MRHSVITMISPAVCGAFAALGLAAAPAPAAAQTVDELTIYGRVGPDSDVKRLSQPVSFADLDLRDRADQAELRRRIDFTARDLCDQLGETNDSDPIAPSCRDAAVRDGLRQADYAIQAAYAGEYRTYAQAPQWTPDRARYYDDDEE